MTVPAIVDNEKKLRMWPCVKNLKRHFPPAVLFSFISYYLLSKLKSLKYFLSKNLLLPNHSSISKCLQIGSSCSVHNSLFHFPYFRCCPARCITLHFFGRDKMLQSAILASLKSALFINQFLTSLPVLNFTHQKFLKILLISICHFQSLDSA